MRPKAVDEVLYQLTTKYVKMSPLTVSQGRVHNYFGMRLGYGTKRKVCITMPENIEGILEAAAYGMDGVSDTPEAHHMFQVREYGSMLTTMRTDLFRAIIETILFAIWRARLDLKTALDFLTKQVQNPDEKNYKNVARTIQYIKRKRGMELTL